MENKKALNITTVSWLLFLGFVVIYAIKTWSWSYWHDEMTILQFGNLAEAIEFARRDIVPPFLHVVVTLINQLSHGIKFFNRLPHVLVSALSLVLFYRILEYFKFRYAWLFAIAGGLSLSLVMYSHNVYAYSAFLLLSLVTFFYGYKIFVADSEEPLDYIWLILAYALLPIVHYYAFFHLLALNLVLLLAILIFSKRKLLQVGKLALISSFMLVGLIPWADSIARTFKETGQLVPGAITYYFDMGVVRNLLYQFSGGSDIWSWSWFVALLFGAGLAIYGFAKKKLDGSGQFMVLLIAYLIILIGFMTTREFPGRLVMWRYFFFLIWPYFFLVFYGLNLFLNQEKRGLATFGLALLMLFGLNNLINTSAYYLSPNRFADWEGLDQMINEMPGKTRVYVHNLGNPWDITYYVRPDIKVGFISPPEEAVSAKDQLLKAIACCKDESVYIHLQDPLAPEVKEDKELREIAAANFENSQVVWDSKFLDFLDKRKIGAFSGYHFTAGGYTKPIVFY